ncbi:MAG: hypothetical protein QXT05_02785 [Candidatus Bilamarchaeaceae archaeon]
MEKKKQLAKNPAEDYGKRQGYKTRLDGCHCYRIFVQDLEKKMSATNVSRYAEERKNPFCRMCPL